MASLNETIADVECDVVLYDGECNFCRSQIDTLRRLDGRGRLKFVSLHDPLVHQRYPDLSHEQLMDQLWIVSRDGSRYGGASAVRFLSRRLPILWAIAPILHFPGSLGLWQYLYRQIAKRRYRIAGRTCENGTCSLHHGGK
jgi:predicted DCC family thiol-disulfide oxidoreductase YuxK